MIMIARKLSLLRQILWAVTLATGFGTLWAVLMLWLGTSMQWAWRGDDQLRQESLVVRSDGVPLIQSMAMDNASPVKYRDLSGHPQVAPERNDQFPVVYMPGEHGAPGFVSSYPRWDQRLEAFVAAEEPTVIWYFVHDGRPEGAGYFIGYERRNNRRVGYIGLNGYRSDPVPLDECIPVRAALIMGYSQWSSVPTWMHSGRVLLPRVDQSDLPPRLVYVPSGNRLRKVDLGARSVTTVFESPEPIESPGIPILSSWLSYHPMKEQPILVRTANYVYVLDHRHNVTKVFAIPTEIDRQSPVSWCELGNGQAIAAFDAPSSPEEAENVKRQTLYRIASDGAIQDRFEVALSTGSPVANKKTRALWTAIALPAPAILFVVDLLFVTEVDRIQSYPAVVIAMLKGAGPSLLVVIGLSLMLGIVAWRRSRSFGLSKWTQITWAVIVLLLGFPAFIGFLNYRRWPIRQPCPSCRAQTPRDRPACAECGTRFPNPSLKGTEVFA
jgi:hypothetical protein